MQNMCIVTFYDISAHKNKKIITMKEDERTTFPSFYFSLFLLDAKPPSE